MILADPLPTAYDAPRKGCEKLIICLGDGDWHNSCAALLISYGKNLNIDCDTLIPLTRATKGWMADGIRENRE